MVTYIYVVFFILGLGMLVRGLMTVAQARAAWTAQSVAGTAQVLACTPVRRDSDAMGMNTFTIAVRYTDTRGNAYTTDLPATQPFQAGDPIDIRFDPKNPKTVYLREHFPGWNLPMALIAFGGGLMLVSVISLAN
jgi:hypothetical protein